MLAREIAQIIEDYAPRSSGMAGDQLGLLAGNPQSEVKGVVTCWSPTLELLNRAAENGANLIIGHEPLTWNVCGRDPEAGIQWYEERHPTAKIPNQRRLELIGARGLTVYRYHSNCPGMQGLADFLRQRLPEDIPVQCLPSGEPWQLL